MNNRFASYSSILTVGLVALVGCGECVFSEVLTGTVTNLAGEPLAATITCDDEDYDGCIPGQTDAQGRFEFDTPMQRPAPFQCGLTALRFSVEGCADSEVLVLPLGTENVDVVLDCPRTP